MSGFSMADLRESIARRLRGRCVQVAGGVLAHNGEKHEDCSTCQTQCGAGVLGISAGVGVARSWGFDALELRWTCPGCGCSVTQDTDALSSLSDARQVSTDPLCHKCR